MTGVDELPPLIEGRDYYVDPEGRYVFTAAYLLARGTCCRSGCRHCPYGFEPGNEPDAADGPSGKTNAE
jgi:hypothetical protein